MINIIWCIPRSNPVPPVSYPLGGRSYCLSPIELKDIFENGDDRADGCYVYVLADEEDKTVFDDWDTMIVPRKNVIIALREQQLSSGKL